MDYRLTDEARQEIDALAEAGVSVTPQEVLDIQRLSLDCEKPDARCGSLARGRSVDVGGCMIYAPTLAGAAFVDEVTPLVNDEQLRFWVLLYALAHGRDAATIYARGKDAVRAVLRWRGKLRCTVAEAVAAAETVMADTLPPPPEYEGQKDGKRADLALRAAALVGGAPEMWETQCSIDAVARVIDIAYTQKLAEGVSAKADARMMAVRRLGEYVFALKQSRKQAYGKPN